MLESCRYCKYRGDIHFPPTKDQDSIDLNGCFYYAYHSREYETKLEVMYLDDLDRQCECWEVDE